MLLMTLLWGCMNDGLIKTEQPDPGLEPIEYDPIYWEACSYQTEDHVCDFTYANAMDTTTTLYDHYGKIVVMKYFTEWCPYCRDAAERVDELVDDEVEVLHIMLQNQYGLEPNQDDAERWANAFNHSYETVLRAGDYIKDPNAEWGPDVEAYPSFIIVDEDMVVKYKIKGWSWEMIQQIVSDMKSQE